MTTLIRLPSLFAVVAGLAMAACGGGDEATPTGSPPVVTAPPPAPQPPPAPPAPAASPLPDALTLTVPSHIDAGGSAAVSSSLGTSVTGLRYAWDFGNGQTASSLVAPTQTYARSGRYEVRLTVSNEIGATRTATAQLLVGHLGTIADTLGCSAPGQGGWCGLPRRFFGSITAVTFADAQMGWALDEEGVVFRSQDAGLNWQMVAARLPTGFNNIGFADASNGFLFAPNRIMRTTDGGFGWSNRSLPIARNQPYSVVNASTVFTTASTFESTRDAGATWDVYGFPAQAFTSAGDIWGIAVGRLMHATTTGSTVTPTSIPSSATVVSVAFADNRTGFAFDTLFRLWKTTDSGDSWQSTTPQALAGTTRCPAPTNNLFPPRLIASSGGTLWFIRPVVDSTDSTPPFFTLVRTCLMRSADGGSTWAEVRTPDPAGTGAPTPVSDRILWQGGRREGASPSDLSVDGGLTWKAIPTGTLQRIDDTRLLLQQGAGVWLRSDDAGTSWVSTLSSGIDGSTSIIASPTKATFLDQDRIVLSVPRGSLNQGTPVLRLLKTEDGGKNWLSAGVLPYNVGGVSSMRFTSLQSGLVLNSTGMILHRTLDGGVTWTSDTLSVQPPGTFSFGNNDFSFVDEQRGLRSVSTSLIPGDRQGPVDHGHLYLTSNGRTWDEVADLPFTVLSLAWVGPNVALAAGTLVGTGSDADLKSCVARSGDAGKTWTTQCLSFGKGFSKVLVANASTAWAVGDRGNVARSDDAGLTWTSVSVPTGNALTDIHFIDALNGYIVGSAGTVLATTDGGGTWSLQSTASTEDMLAIHGSAPGIVRLVSKSLLLYDTVTGGF